MGNPLFHAESSATRFGGRAEDFLPIHKFLDQSKLYIPDCRHRCLLHNNFGIALCEQLFGDFYTRPSDGIKVCIRTVAEQHVIEDLRCIPTVEIMLHEMPIRPWMRGFTSDQVRRMQNLVIQNRAENDSGDTRDD
jgi:hypothetical protein